MPFSFFFLFLDHKFSCVETVKYKFDSGTWYVRPSEQIYGFTSLCLCGPTPVSLQRRSQTYPELRPVDYIIKETTSVSLKLSNFAIKRLPGCLEAEHQILLRSAGQMAVTLTEPWHLIMGVCYCVKH